MIAYSLHGGNGDDGEKRQRAGTRAGQTAAQLRRARAARMRHRNLVLGLGGLAIATLVVISYLTLMSGVYRLDYTLHELEATRKTLAEESARLDDGISPLESRDRLAAIADKLGMRDSAGYAVAIVPRPVEEKPHGLAFLPIASNWLR